MSLTKNRLTPLEDFSTFSATVSFVRLHRQNKRPVTKRSRSHPPEKVPFIPYFFIANYNYASFVSQQSPHGFCAKLKQTMVATFVADTVQNMGYNGRRLQ